MCAICINKEMRRICQGGITSLIRTICSILCSTSCSNLFSMVVTYEESIYEKIDFCVTTIAFSAIKKLFINSQHSGFGRFINKGKKWLICEAEIGTRTQFVV